MSCISSHSVFACSGTNTGSSSSRPFPSRGVRTAISAIRRAGDGATVGGSLEAVAASRWPGVCVCSSTKR